MKNENEKIRLDQYVSKEKNWSRSKAQKQIEQGKVLVNGKSASSHYLLREEDKVEIEEEVIFDVKEKKEDIPIDIVYEDEYLAIINKASGMVVHPAPGNYNGTLVNALLYHFDLSKMEDGMRPGIVHRIDKDTSGLMVVAKDDKTHELLSEMIKNKEVERTYLALVHGVIHHDTGTIDAPIGRDTVSRQKMMVTDVHSKEAITHFRVVKRYKEYTLLECKLETGRTHQIRVHMAYIGHPIANDPVYGKEKNTTEFGQLLHSWKIRFTHPITKKELFFEKNPPKEFQEYLDKLD